MVNLEIPFTKMQGLGNDFVVINATQQAFKLSPAEIIKMADRHLGIGFDQLLVLEPSSNKTADFDYRIFNADGSEVSQCGNGARCIARFIQEQRLSEKNEIILNTHAGELQTRLQADGQVTVNMGVPTFIPSEIPFTNTNSTPPYQTEIAGNIIHFYAAGMGNPHAVIQVKNIDDAPVNTIGKEMESNSLFPERVNVGFMQIISPDEIRLRVFERGAGETLACGSGACAAAAVGRKYLGLSDTITVQLLGGKLIITWPDLTAPLWMTGPAVTVFQGTW